MPGETFTCVGCHESKVHTPPSLDHTPIAVQRGPLPLENFYGPPRAFGFNTEIQPILDAKCISCHNESHEVLDLRFGNASICGRQFSQAYQNLVQSNGNDYRGKYVWWQCAEDSPLLQLPYRTGSCRSPLVKHLEDGHKETEMTQEEMDKIRCWIDLGIPGVGHYGEGFSEADSLAVEARIALRREWEEQERLNIEAFVRDNASAAAPRSPMRGRDADRSTMVLGVSVNPGTGRACIRIRVPSGRKTGGSEPVLTLYNSTGRCMRSIPIGHPGPGTHSIEFDRLGGPGLPTGILHWELRETGYSTSAGTIRIP
jgi:hypothetical protein